MAPFGGGGPGAASAAVATEGGAAWLEAGNTAFRARRRRRRRTTRVAAGAIHGCPVRVRERFADPIESPGRSAAGGRPARVLLRSVRSSLESLNPPGKSATRCAPHATAIQTWRVKASTTMQGQAPPAVQQERRCTVHWSRRDGGGATVCCAQCSGQACMCHLLRRHRKAQKRGHSSPCICHLPTIP